VAAAAGWKAKNTCRGGNNAIGQSGIENRDDLVVALARFGHGHIQPGELLRHADRGTDLQAAAGQVIEHADFLDYPGGMVIGQHHAHDAKAQRLRSRGERSDQQIWRGRIGAAKMVFAEKDALEAKRLVARP
jgi:hypothetical protein